MQYYSIVVMANKKMNNGEHDYSQEFNAYDSENRLCASHYQANNKLGNKFIYRVIQKDFVKANTGSGAILKFQKWQREGLGEDYLSGDFI